MNHNNSSILWCPSLDLTIKLVITVHYIMLHYIGQESIWPGIFPKGGGPEINHPVCTPNIVFLRSAASCGECMKTRKERIHI